MASSSNPESDDDDTLEFEIEVVRSSSSASSITSLTKLDIEEVDTSPTSHDFVEPEPTTDQTSPRREEEDEQEKDVQHPTATTTTQVEDTKPIQKEQISLVGEQIVTNRPHETVQMIEITQPAVVDETRLIDKQQNQLQQESQPAIDETLIADRMQQVQLYDDEKLVELETHKKDEVDNQVEVKEAEIPVEQSAETITSNLEALTLEATASEDLSKPLPQSDELPDEHQPSSEPTQLEPELEPEPKPELDLLPYEANLLRESFHQKTELICFDLQTFQVQTLDPFEVAEAVRIIAAPEVYQAERIILEINDEKNKTPEISLDSPRIQISPAQEQLLTSQLLEAFRGRRFSVDSCGEDLEREFDEEPTFEARQVKVKQNCDPRSEYELEDELGRGRFGTVLRCTEKATGRKLAAKFVNMRRREDREDVEREVGIMSQLQHKRLLQLYDAFDNGSNEMCLITELVEGGELFERIVDDDFELTEKKAAIFMRQICEGTEYMHSKNIVHLDMKPENILCLSKTGNRIKLIDFGLARQLSDEEPLRVMFGTPDFAAPEVLAYDLVSLATDMWSVGVICYVLLSGLSPFMGDNDIETMANVTRATFDFNDSSFEPISDLAKDFISKLLVKDQNKRLKPSECLKHPWLRRGGADIEASVLSRRGSMIAGEFNLGVDASAALAALAAAAAMSNSTNLGSPGSGGGGSGSTPVTSAPNGSNPLTPTVTTSIMSLDCSKRNLKKYVVRRRWHRTVHAIMALSRMGASFKQALASTTTAPQDR